MIFICVMLSLVIVTVSVLQWRRNNQVRRWRKCLLLDKHQKAFTRLYAPINAFELSQQSRSERDAIEYIYGEANFESFIAVIALCHPNQDTVFYDLGSGVGKLVVACAMVFNLKKSCGIERFTLLHQCAIERQRQLAKEPAYHVQAPKIDFISGDFLAQSLGDATLIFINATAFFAEYWVSISRYIAAEVRSGTIVISTSKRLKSEAFLSLKDTQMAMSWGVVSAFIQQKK